MQELKKVDEQKVLEEYDVARKILATIDLEVIDSDPMGGVHLGCAKTKRDRVFIGPPPTYQQMLALVGPGLKQVFVENWDAGLSGRMPFEWLLENIAIATSALPMVPCGGPVPPEYQQPCDEWFPDDDQNDSWYPGQCMN